MAHLSLRRVSKIFGSGVAALHPLNLEIQDGQLVVLVGPSGCGKSTLLRIIAGLEKPTAGELFLDGVDVAKVHPKDRDVAMVFQNYALYPHMTVRENLGFGLKMRGVLAEARKDEIDLVAGMLGLETLLGRKPPQLSGGQQQRVALGRAIVRRPKVFLFDEPFSNLDATLRASTRTELLRLHRRLEATSIFVTHDQIEAMTMADILVVMKDGKVLQVGPPLDVYRQPANLFVAQFIGFPPMNLLDPDLLSLGPAGLVLGLRAEHVSLAPIKEQPILNGKAMLLEPLGNEILLTCLVGGQDIVTRVPANTSVRPGQDVRLFLDLDSAIWFKRDTGEAHLMAEREMPRIK